MTDSLPLPEITLQHACPGCHDVPGENEIARWVAAALRFHSGERGALPEITLRIVDWQESADLNRQWRQKEGPTNILSFPYENPPGADVPSLGDMVICAPLVHEEARAQNKTEQAHWAHLVVHGTLHLLGHDHQTEADAERMENLETQIMAELGYPDPYAEPSP